MNEPANSRGDPWGPYREPIQELLEGCADYLGRLQRSLAGEIAPDRHYFNEKAALLQLTAVSLVRYGQDVERWLQECGTDITQEDETGRYIEECTLPGGHDGDHTAALHRSPATTAAERARDLADRTDKVSRQLGWLHTDIDHRPPEGHALIPEQRTEVHDIKTSVDQIAHDASVLARVLTATDHCLGIDAQLADQRPGPHRDHGDLTL